MPLIDHFNLLAPFYDHFVQFLPPEKLVSIVKLPVQGRLLDAGGGTGRVSSIIHDQAAQTIIADVSMGMLRQAGKKAGLIPICGFSEALPFPNETFERIIMVDALHHVVNQSKTAAELWRVLSNGGRLIIEEPDIRKNSVKIVALIEKITLMRSHFLTPLQIRELFTFSGAISQLEYEGFNSWIIVDKHIPD